MTHWKALTAACALAATTLTGATAFAAEGRQVALNYEVRVGGVHGVRADTVLRMAGGRFVAEAEIGKEGLLDKLSKTYRALHIARGRLLDGRITPDATEAKIVSGDEARALRASYASDGTLNIAQNPPAEIKPGREVSADQRRGALDPMMAALVALVGRQDPCAGTIPIYDGRTRFDLVPKRIGSESFPSEDFKIKGQSVVCEVRLRKVAGYKPGTDPDEDFDKPAKLWLGALDDSGRLYPLRVEIETSFGTIAGQLRKASIRPLTADEELALAK
jgi:hypothetical protein